MVALGTQQIRLRLKPKYTDLNNRKNTEVTFQDYMGSKCCITLSLRSTKSFIASTYKVTYQEFS